MLGLAQFGHGPLPTDTSSPILDDKWIGMAAEVASCSEMLRKSSLCLAMVAFVHYNSFSFSAAASPQQMQLQREGKGAGFCLRGL